MSEQVPEFVNRFVCEHCHTKTTTPYGPGLPGLPEGWVVRPIETATFTAEILCGACHERTWT